MIRIALLALVMLPLWTVAQVGVGVWRDHLPYGNCIDVCDGGDVIYGATPYSVFYYDLEDNSMNRLTTIEGLAEADISSINYDSESGALLIGYVNGNIDFVYNQNNIVNLGDLKNSTVPADKSINDIYFLNGKAYLACGFGIVVVDIAKNEISESYIIGQNTTYVNVQNLEIIDGQWHASTDEGIYVADVSNPFLVSFESWNERDDLPFPEPNILNHEINSQSEYLFIQDPDNEEAVYRIFYKDLDSSTWEEWDEYRITEFTDIYLDEENFVTQDFFSIYIYDLEHNLVHETWTMGSQNVRGNTCIKDSRGMYWMADKESGLLGDNFTNNYFHVIPPGPYSRNVRRMDAYNHNIWAAGGGLNASFVSQWNGSGVYGLVDGEWISRRDFDNAVVPDFMDIAINPLDNSEIYAGSWHYGLYRIKNGEFTDHFDETNSTLTLNEFEGGSRIGVAVVNFDSNGNLWFSSHRQEEVLHVRTPNGNFYAYDLSPFLDENSFVLDILATQQGYVFVSTKESGILAIDHKGTISDTSDDVYKLIGTAEGNGNLPTSRVLCMEEDLDGELWVGTIEGPAIFYSQEAIFSENNFDCQQIFITQDGNVQILLQTETINAIELDGGNRKWIATQNSGVYLISDEGVETINHFTEENSPLLSNTVNDIVINQDDGEVFFATAKGIIGFRSDATNFYEDMEDLIKVYPNPVRPEYEGLISIDNLSKDVDVKIADVSGNVVYQTVANGGRAVWDGTRFDGQKVSTGVYLVFATNEDGSSTAVAKIAFIK